MSQTVHASHFVIKLWVDDQVEIVINLLNLCEVLVLHSATGTALGAVLGGVGEEHLVDYNVVDVNLLLCQLNSESFRLVHGEELRDAHGNESSLGSILELLVHLFNLCLHVIDSIEHTLLHLFWVLSTTIGTLTHHILHLAEHSTELVLELDQLDQTLLQDVGEVEQAQSVTGGRCVENDQGEVVLIK